ALDAQRAEHARELAAAHGRLEEAAVDADRAGAREAREAREALRRTEELHAARETALRREGEEARGNLRDAQRLMALLWRREGAGGLALGGPAAGREAPPAAPRPPRWSARKLRTSATTGAL
ncbi:unnamed protein product, partial [Prorocentrum cordatum]